MDELIKMLDKNLEYTIHEIKEGIILIYVTSKREETICPYCGHAFLKVHSHNPRVFQDLPIQGNKQRNLNF